MLTKAPRFIYGLYDSQGRCHYVGQTISQWHRHSAHRLKRPSLTFRVIRKASWRTGARIESQVILAYQKRGQCELNKRTEPSACHALPGAKVFWVERNITFISKAQAARHFGISVQTIKNWIKDPRQCNPTLKPAN